MKKLNLFNQFVDIETKFKSLSNEYINFYTKSIDKVSEFKTRVITSFTTSLVNNGKEGLQQYPKEASEVFDLQAMMDLPSYSSYNCFVWIRIYSRKIQQLKCQENKYHNKLRRLLKEIKPIESGLEELSLKKRELERFNKLKTIKNKIKKLLEWEVDKVGDFFELLQLIFASGWKMSKTNFLSLISVNHDLNYWDGPRNRTLEYIADLPEEIDYETFQEAIFIQKIEHDQDCYLFDIYMSAFMKTMDRNKELKEKSFDMIQDVFGPVPTYTAEIDVFGEVTSLTPNPLKLKVVK